MIRGGRLVEADVVRNAVQPVDLEHLLGDDHELGEAAVVLVADGCLVLADLHPALPAFVALPAGNRGDALDAVADLEPALRLGADLDDLTGDLVTHRRDPGDVDVAVVADLDVRAAGRAVADPDLDLAGTAVRLGNILESHISGGVEPEGLHAMRSFAARYEDVVSPCPNVSASSSVPP
jgi:hypothetical protein